MHVINRWSAFFREWWLLATKAHSKVGAILPKVVAMVGGGVAWGLSHSINLALITPWGQLSGVTWGLLLAAFVYLPGTAGAAWVLASAPRLWVATELEPDESVQALRLRVRNIGPGRARVRGQVLSADDDNGVALIRKSRFPVVLHWSDIEPDTEWLELEEGDGGAIVIAVIQRHQGAPLLALAAVAHEPTIEWNNGAAIHLRLDIRASGWKPQFRSFMLQGADARAEIPYVVHYAGAT